jgi:general secretion pathway protein G
MVTMPLTRALRRRRRAGFTLIELIIVIAIIGILAAIVMPALGKMPRRAREAALKTNLRTMRDVIDQYYGDKGSYPKTLEALVTERYLRMVPDDPITKRRDTWILIYEEESEEDGPPPESEQDDAAGPGILDVKSGAPGLSLSGTPYSDW